MAAGMFSLYDGFRTRDTILGPTGAGKSSFIEALSGEGQTLGISKDQLAGFTQEVAAYEVKNATVEMGSWIYKLYLIGAPGFSDSKISELEIITKVKQWMSDYGRRGVNGVLYFTPITDTRASGSKRRTIQMIQSLLNNTAFDRVNIVTTMWDRLGNPQAKHRAEANFSQLRDEIWKGPVSRGAKISRYHNNFDSAVEILRDILESAQISYPPLGYAPIEPWQESALFLYKDLLDRIRNAQQEKELLRQERIRLITNPDPQLESVVLSRLPEVKGDLAKFMGQLVDFGNPPPGFEGVPERCTYQNLLDRVNEAWEEQAALKVALAQLHSSPDHVREVILRGQVDLVESELVEHVMKLSNPPRGCEKNLRHTIKALIRTPNMTSPSVPNPPADLEVTSTQRASGNNTLSATAPVADIVGISAGVDQHPSFNTPAGVSTTAPPGRDDVTISRLASATPEGSISSRVYLNNRFNPAFRSFKDKFTFRSRREGRH
ncbi:hypothetical protein BJ165DRAFT_1595658 [Panaeolus papilionaceus]|nr:hypothetical protein BJ165DRAFT_1595658 [Panaeolus papilionaceus]